MLSLMRIWTNGASIKTNRNHQRYFYFFLGYFGVRKLFVRVHRGPLLIGRMKVAEESRKSIKNWKIISFLTFSIDLTQLFSFHFSILRHGMKEPNNIEEIVSITLNFSFPSDNWIPFEIHSSHWSSQTSSNLGFIQ